MHKFSCSQQRVWIPKKFALFPGLPCHPAGGGSGSAGGRAAGCAGKTLLVMPLFSSALSFFLSVATESLGTSINEIN